MNSTVCQALLFSHIHQIHVVYNISNNHSITITAHLVKGKMKLNAAQYTFLYQLVTKFIAYVGGFGSGKTFVGCLFLLIQMAKHPGITVGYFAPTYRDIRDIFYPTFEEAAEMLGFSIEVKLADKEVLVYRGNRLYGVVKCRSMDNPSSIVGFKIAFALVDELDTLEVAKGRNAWRKIIARLRLKVEGVENRVAVTTTPEGYKLTYEMFYKEPTQSYSMVQASTYENEEYLPDDYIPSLMESYTDALVDAYLRGEFRNLESGTVYRSYDRKKHRSTETVQGNEPIFVGMDFNIDRMAATIYVRRKNGQEWHAVDEIHKAYDTTAVCEILKERYPNNPITVYPDATGKRRDTRDGPSESDLAIISDPNTGFGFKISHKVTKAGANPRVKNRVNATNAALEKGRMFVNDTNCPNVAECLEQQCYDDNGQPVKDGIRDDQNDATTYPIAWEMPITKPIRQLKVNFAS